ncbi:WYL domain-containing protein [Prochlorothrix hollandica]|uniref:WYL domain-containing protein n=1 Tax=Prochlorothrix hollandica TaxID=1223 RepID=UPI00333F6E4C
MTRKGKAITLSLAEHHKTRLEQLAQEFEMTWGEKKPNVSKLLKAIAEGKLTVTKNFGWSADRLETLNRILGHCQDQGDLAAALEVGQLLLERSEISEPLRQEIQTWVNSPKTALRTDIDRYIRLQRPFQLSYRDAADLSFRFTVRHGRIQRHEDRDYLDCWCEETAGNQDVNPLHHNWSLRLDRIPEEAALIAVEGSWRSEPSFLLVEFHLLDRLAFAYRSKNLQDQEVGWLTTGETKRVVRRVENTFWFLREIHRYGPDCLIVSPDDVREHYVKTLQATLGRYLNP